MADLAVAVIGAGVHGSRYAEHLLRRDVPGLGLAGVCRRSEADAAKWRSRGVRFETDFRSLVDDPAVDAVVVASPPTFHEEHALAAIARGKPLLLEKPVAQSAAACARIRAAATRAALPVLVGHSHRFNEVVTLVRAALRPAGPLRSLSLLQQHPRAPLPWQFERPGGGALLCLAVHLADLARWFTGEEIAVESCRLAGEPGEAEGSAEIAARTPSGVAIEMEVSIVAPSRRGGIRARADAYEVEGDFVGGSWSLTRGGTPDHAENVRIGPGLVPLLMDFHNVIRVDERWKLTAATLDDGIAAVEFVERCRAAAGHSPR